MVLSILVLSEAAKTHDGGAAVRVSKTSFIMIYFCLCLGSKYYIANQPGNVLQGLLPDSRDNAPFIPMEIAPSINLNTLVLPKSLVTHHPIHAAILAGSLDMTQAALDTFADVDVMSKQKTPLMLAATLGRVDIMEYLLDQGADVFAENDEGNTALHFACDAGHVYATYVLLTAGADLDLPNQARKTPEDVAMAHLQDLLDTNGVIDEAIVRAWDRHYKAYGFTIPTSVLKQRRKRYGRFLHNLSMIPEQN
ncbi:hypothetical protein Ae201684P_017066 [Aphanomyces euteiches]|uniref:Uncharacterized protein n=1 Tax=Aphanomyces euteiches TaxID=100861 RepID=A0A6G0XJN4_9STRA|nr:hypothetical protein Ae201684_004058 [Aphanomyces euteiches]KAH9094460.1 hypothetical protein Ae201684P_017066 [Aphanomyces euteiches]KAH9144553.1 hypothetical protein AeRB84_011500 [Aphanomyces euteiches]